MGSKKRNWIVGPWSAWRSKLSGGAATVSRDNPFAVEVKGARIRDKDTELVYEATIVRKAGAVWLSSLTVMATHEDQRIDAATMRRIPTQRIAEQVAMQLAADEASTEQHGREVPNFVSDARRGRHDAPDLEQIARDVDAGLTRRTLATKYQVSVSTVDNWLGQARRARLIPPAKTGRPATRKDSR